MPATPVHQPVLAARDFLDEVAARTEDEALVDRTHTSTRLLMAAAALVVLVGLVVWLITLANPEAPIATTPQVSTSTTAPSTSTSSSSTTTTLSEEEAVWQAIPAWQFSEPGDTGEFRSDTFRAQLTFAVPEGWVRFPNEGGELPFPAGGEFPNGMRPVVPAGDPDRGGVFIYRHEEETPEMLIERLTSHPSAANVETGATTIGGLAASEIRAEVTGLLNYIMITPTAFTEMTADAAFVSSVLEVDGQTVSVVVYALDAADLPELEQAIQPIIDSIRWRAVGG